MFICFCCNMRVGVVEHTVISSMIWGNSEHLFAITHYFLLLKPHLNYFYVLTGPITQSVRVADS